MSVFAKKQLRPKCLMCYIALSIVTYWRLNSSIEIEALILVETDFGR